MFLDKLKFFKIKYNEKRSRKERKSIKPLSLISSFTSFIFTNSAFVSRTMTCPFFNVYYCNVHVIYFTQGIPTSEFGALTRAIINISSESLFMTNTSLCFQIFWSSSLCQISGKEIQNNL